VREVEGVHVGRRASSEVLDRSLTDPHPAGPLDCRRGVVERAAGRFDRGEAAQPVGVLLRGQVQHRVGWVQVGVPSPPVGDARDHHIAEPGSQQPFPPGLGRAPHDLTNVDHRIQPCLVFSPQIQAVLEQLAQQRQPIGV
jgi:hypothetical protein